MLVLNLWSSIIKKYVYGMLVWLLHCNYSRMKQFFKKTVKKHIEALQNKHDELMIILVICPVNCFRYVFLDLELKWLEFKITIWEALV